MTRVQVASDLHADFTSDRIDEQMAVACDLHLWLGDAAAPARHAIDIMAETLKDSTAVKAYVIGNHDLYHTARYPQSYLQDEVERARELGKAHGIHVMSNDVLYVGTTRVLGTPLFTNFKAGTDTMSPNQKKALSQKGYFGDERYDNGRKDYHEDFRQIRYGAPGTKNRFTPSQWIALHDEAMVFLRAELAKDWEGETIVATHMAPSPESLMPGHHNHDWLYASTDCGDLFAGVDLWCHGHIHASRDYEIDGCRVLANPRGYPNKDGSFENPNWDPALVIDVERRYAPKIGGM
jgi:predicted phosphodiesterase